MYKYKYSEPRWINFENPEGKKGGGAIENNGAKGHAWEHFYIGEEKVLCDFEGCGVIRRIWITLNERCEEVIKNVIIKMYWDNADEPQVNVPLGDFFCMSTGKMKPFENHFFSTAEGRSFGCTMPMPFRKKCKIVLCNNSKKYINNLFYDINLTLEDVSDEDMYFYAEFRDIEQNEIEKEVEILSGVEGEGRFVGASIGVIPKEEWYGDLWWGEGEVKIYLDGDKENPTLSGTGAEDYVGSAWELSEFINDCQGCVVRENNTVSMYRFHVKDPIFFKENISVKIQAMGGGDANKVKKVLEQGYPCIPVTYDDGDVHHIYKEEYDEIKGYVNFFRCDHYRITAYYYKKSIN